MPTSLGTTYPGGACQAKLRLLRSWRLHVWCCSAEANTDAKKKGLLPADAGDCEGLQEPPDSEPAPVKEASSRKKTRYFGSCKCPLHTLLSPA